MALSGMTSSNSVLKSKFAILAVWLFANRIREDIPLRWLFGDQVTI